MDEITEVSEQAAGEGEAKPFENPVAQPFAGEKVDEVKPPPAPQRLTLHFLGSSGEYFRIWIVNVALTIATLGLYAAWAKVRTRRYFYAHTVLGGRPFDYLGQPKAILIGHLIVAGVVLLSNVFSGLFPLIGGVAAFGLWSFIPYLLYKAHRFKAHNTSYRGIRFAFGGKAPEAYWVYGAYFLFMMFVGGLIYPYWVLRQKDYSYNHLSFGDAKGRLDNSAYMVKRIYLYYFISIVLGVVGLVLFIPFFGSVIQLGSGGAEGSQLGAIGVGLAVSLLVVVLASFIQQYMYARVTNLCWNNFTLGELSFEADVRVLKLLYIRLTNIAAIVLTLGLAAPWAKVRRTSYLLGCFTVIAPEGLENFVADENAEDNAIGDAAADFFDFDVGW